MTPSPLRQCLLAAVLAACCLAAPAFAQAPAATANPLRAVLQESQDKGRGVTVYIKGNSFSMIVSSVDDTWVVGRSNTSSRIVVRLDRIDGAIAGF